MFYTGEAENEAAVTFTSFEGKETVLRIPVADGKFTLNGGTYAKAKRAATRDLGRHD